MSSLEATYSIGHQIALNRGDTNMPMSDKQRGVADRAKIVWKEVIMALVALPTTEDGKKVLEKCHLPAWCEVAYSIGEDAFRKSSGVRPEKLTRLPHPGKSHRSKHPGSVY